MTTENHKLIIALNLNKHSVDVLVNDLAAKAVEVEALTARIAELEAQLSPKPVADIASA